ncbi:mucin-5AC isoform X2 [Ceratitis capitata]|uniref:mucin-5AC isoform X1 n=1 Tax=Ceratitis capitata TaxID=7213 RepID=UPI0006189609|nr:mucin-5AC isoform X1 [Ceratitis capitata]XP_020717206.1 mucin-5AC isoform X2 [Ceratitis capitata]
MSNMKNGFSTLNRWLGKKNKAEKATTNGKLSKSSTNLNSLSVSSTNINETSQLEYNRITPLPVATSNAPFEQTFRITVLLPKDQLYVARLGARVPLSKLLELVCENKLLDATKYEFRNPVDYSQVYNCDLTIGAVGLSEIRLCHKSESYDNFNADEIIKLHRTAIIRDSLSSSEFSSRYSKHTTKTTSPYSSSNSLNSMDSTGMNCVRTPVSPPATLISAPSTQSLKMAAPPRKKRAAPRPPSQTAIPEKTVLVTTNGEPNPNGTHTNGIDTAQAAEDALSRKTRYVSTPNLSTSPDDVNGFDCNGNNGAHTPNGELEMSLNGYDHFDGEHEQAQVKQKNARNLCGGSVQNLSSASAAQQSMEFPEPSPRKRMIQIKKKTVAPAPPPRGGAYADADTLSLRSMTPSTAPDTPLTPLTPDSPLLEHAHTLPSNFKAQSPAPQAREPKETASTTLETHDKAAAVPKPLPRVTTNTLLNASNTELVEPVTPLTTTNVSKIMLNRTPTPEPRSLSAEPPQCVSFLGAHIAGLKNGVASEHEDDDVSSKQTDSGSFLGAHIATLKSEASLPHDDDSVSKQADSGIGEPVPSPIPDSLPSVSSTHDGKSAFESSSDDDDIVKVYNFKLGKTVAKSPAEAPQTLEDFVVLAAEAQTDSGENTPAPITQEATPNFSDSASWNFSIPISPPPNFADGRFAEGFASEKPDMPITPKIKERPVLDFEAISHNESCVGPASNRDQKAHASSETQLKAERMTPLPSPTTPLNEIVDELSAIISEKRLDTLIKKPEEQPKIEAVKPNTLTNFSITTITQQTAEKETEMAKSIDRKAEITSEQTPTPAQHAPVQQKSPPEVELERSSTQDHAPTAQIVDATIETNGYNTSRRRSSGELSIGETPTLQSPEMVKTILNSRKNSTASSSSGGGGGGGEGESKGVKVFSKAAETVPQAEPPKNVVNASVEHSVDVKQATNDPPASTKPKELPKVYRYSGPPSINFSTWSERPKVQVAIKNEGDYIFGGKNADSQSAAVTTAAIEISTNTKLYNRSNRVSMPAFWAERENASLPAPPVAPKPASKASPTERMGIPEKEYRVPVNVKPLRDVTIENVPAQAAESVMTQAATRKTTSITTVLLNGNATAAAENHIEETHTRRTHTSTLPRSNANRFSMPPTSITVGPALLRSTSISQLEANKLKPAHNASAATAPTPAPFGQNTLRKTGLKEKILAKEAASKDDDESAAPTHQQEKSSAQTTAAFSVSGVKHKPLKPLQSAKLEMQLSGTSTSAHLNRTNATPTPKFTTTTTTITQSFEKSKSMSLAPTTTPTPPTPPAPPLAPLKAVALHTPNGGAPTTPSGAEPRDQLLLAIRSFKRENLTRV